MNTEDHPLMSICLSVKNRSRWVIDEELTLWLFPNFLDSLVQSIRPEDRIEIVIADWSSTDWPLQEWVPSRLSGLDWKIIEQTGIFHRGTGRNAAAEHARGKYLFFLDSDMLVNRPVMEKAMLHCQSDTVYFPHSFYFIDREHTRGFWCRGKGNCAILASTFKHCGRWPSPPHYTRSFDEDQKFYQNVEKKGYKIVREDVRGFIHQYHPGKSVRSVQKPSQKHYIIPKPEM